MTIQNEPRMLLFQFSFFVQKALIVSYQSTYFTDEKYL